MALEGVSASSVAITGELLVTANRLRRAILRSPPFGMQFVGSGASVALALFGKHARIFGARASDVLVVPGLGIADEGSVAERLARPDADDARRRLRQADAKGAEIASSCSGVFLLASAGLLDGRRATTAWWLAPLFRRLFPAVKLESDAMVVHDGRFTTAAAGMAQLDLMLALIARHAGDDLATRCARYHLAECRGSQSRYISVGFLTAKDWQIGLAERWARDHLDKSLSVGDIAAAAHLSARTFARRLARATGLSPVRFIQRLRVEQAIELLETSQLSLDEISRRVGYAEPSTLRRLLRREGAQGVRQIRSAR